MGTENQRIRCIIQIDERKRAGRVGQELKVHGGGDSSLIVSGTILSLVAREPFAEFDRAFPVRDRRATLMTRSLPATQSLGTKSVQRTITIHPDRLLQLKGWFERAALAGHI